VGLIVADYQNKENTDVRYGAFHSVFPTDRSFSCIDWGSDIGIFARNIAREFPQSIVLSVEKIHTQHNKQSDLAKKEGLKNIIISGADMRLTLIRKLYESTFFSDYQLLLNILHHYGHNGESDEDFAEYVAKSICLAQTSIVQLPRVGEKGSAGWDRMFNRYGKTEDVGLFITEAVKKLQPEAEVIVEEAMVWHSGWGDRKMYIVRVNNMKRYVGHHLERGNTPLMYVLQYDNKDKQWWFDRMNDDPNKKAGPKKSLIPGFTIDVVARINPISPTPREIYQMWDQSVKRGANDPSLLNFILTNKELKYIDEDANINSAKVPSDIRKRWEVKRNEHIKLCLQFFKQIGAI
jgi:hypothetical protein